MLTFPIHSQSLCLSLSPSYSILLLSSIRHLSLFRYLLFLSVCLILFLLPVIPFLLFLSTSLSSFSPLPQNFILLSIATFCSSWKLFVAHLMNKLNFLLHLASSQDFFRTGPVLKNDLVSTKTQPSRTRSQVKIRSRFGECTRNSGDLIDCWRLGCPDWTKLVF